MICKKGNTMRRFCMAGIVMSTFLLLAGCGDDGQKENEETEQVPGAIKTWDGARADLSRGLKAKEAIYHYGGINYAITYDINGKVASVTVDNNCPEDFAEVLESDEGALYGYQYPSANSGLLKKSYYSYTPEIYSEGYVYARIPKISDDNKTVTFSSNGAIVTYESAQASARYVYDRFGRFCESVVTYSGNDGGNIFYSHKKGDKEKTIVRYAADNELYVSYIEQDAKREEWEYDTNWNVVKYLKYESQINADRYSEMQLTDIREWEYDEAGNILSGKYTEGHRSDSKDYYESYNVEYYDEAGNITERSRQISIGGKEYIVNKTEYLRDKKGRITKEITSELLASKNSLDGQADWCNAGGNTELYVTQEIEYKYDDNIVKGTHTTYKYEANKDFSKVNLLEDETLVIDFTDTVRDQEEGYWTITYFTDEEIEQYLHDQEFSPVG